MAKQLFTFDEAGMRTTIKGVRKALGLQGRPIPQPKGPRDEGGGCDSQNAIIDVIVFGSPTGGTFDLELTVNSVAETLTFDWNDTASAVATVLATHTELASTDVSVSSLGTFPDATIRIEFIDTQANTNITLPIADWTSLTGGTGTAIVCVMAQLGHA